MHLVEKSDLIDHKKVMIIYIRYKVTCFCITKTTEKF